MKWWLFGFMVVAGMPLMFIFAAWSSRARRWLFGTMLASTVTKISVNFCSQEFYRGADRGFEISLCDLIAVSLGLGVIFARSAAIRWLPFNSLCMALFFLIACLSATGSSELLYAEFTLVKMAKAFLLYWTAYNVFRLDRPWQALWWAVVALVSYEAVEVLRQRYLGGIYRPHGTFDHSNTIPSYLLLILPMFTAWMLCESDGPRWRTSVAIATVLGMCGCIAATLSRAGVALAATAVTAVFGRDLWNGITRRRLAVVTLFGLLALAGVAKSMDTWIYRFLNAPKASRKARDEFNQAAALMASTNVFGVGINCFAHVMSTQPKYRDHVEVLANEQQAGVCHHIYRLTAAETGYFGLFAFLLILFRFWWIAARSVWGPPSRERMLQYGLIAGITAVHVCGLVEWVFRLTPVMNLFLITSAISVALAEQLQLVPRRQLRPTTLVNKPAWAL